MKIIETERLIMRPLIDADFEDFYEYAMDDELSRMYGLPLKKDRERVFKIFSAFLNGGKTYALVYKENQKMTGHLMIVPLELPEEEIEKLGDKKGVTLAFAIAPKYQRKGLIFEALTEVIEELFYKQNVDFIHCGYYEFNEPSKKLQEKLGFQYYSTHTAKRRDDEVKIIDNLLWRS